MSLPRTINIIVTGTARCGKKTFINSIRETEAYDGGLVPASSYFGRVRLLPDVTLFLFPAPGSRPLRLISAILDQSFMGAVVLVDSTRPDGFREACDIVDSVLSENIPIICAATKQDMPDAWSVNDLRIALRFEDHIPLIPCRAHERDSVKTVLEGLFAEILYTLNPESEETTETFLAPPPPLPPALPEMPPVTRPLIKPLPPRPSKASAK